MVRIDVKHGVWVLYLCSALSGRGAETNAVSASVHTTREQFKEIQWVTNHVGTPLDLGKYELVFSNDFKTLDGITPEDGKGPWFAPGHTTFGGAKFMPPGKDGPFSLVGEGIQIRAMKSEVISGPKEKKAKWTTGSMQTVDGKGAGFALQYGYFEMTAKFPASKGAWPAFWLLSQNGYLDKTKTRTEIDIVEWYGGDPKGHHAAVHLWPAQQRTPAMIQKATHRSKYYNLKSLLTDGKLEGFHRYGAEVTPEWVIFYFDRKELERYPMVPEFHTPLYMVVDLALFEKEAEQAISPMDMTVKEVVAFRRK